MANAFLTSLFEFKAWANRSFYGALLAQELPGDNKNVIVSLFTLDHALRVDRLFRARLEGKPEPYRAVVSDALPNLQSLADEVAETDSWYLHYVRGLSEPQLDESIAFQFMSDSDAGKLTRAEILAHVLTHTHSHRPAVAQMLEPLQLRLPSDMFTSYVSESRRRFRRLQTSGGRS